MAGECHARRHGRREPRAIGQRLRVQPAALSTRRSRTGHRKPVGSAALSITTAVPKSGGAPPYDDDEGADGLHRYTLRRDQGGTTENQSLSVATRDRVPLIWFYGIAPGIFNAISPVWLTAKESHLDQFVLALTDAQLTVQPNSPVEETLRRCVITEPSGACTDQSSPAK